MTPVFCNTEALPVLCNTRLLALSTPLISGRGSPRMLSPGIGHPSPILGMSFHGQFPYSSVSRTTSHPQHTDVTPVSQRYPTHITLTLYHSDILPLSHQYNIGSTSVSHRSHIGLPSGLKAYSIHLPVTGISLMVQMDCARRWRRSFALTHSSYRTDHPHLYHLTPATPIISINQTTAQVQIHTHTHTHPHPHAHTHTHTHVHAITTSCCLLISGR